VVGIVTFWLMGPVVNVFRRWHWFNAHIWPRQSEHREYWR
jgi:hypothetical protein